MFTDASPIAGKDFASVFILAFILKLSRYFTTPLCSTIDTETWVF